MLIRRVLHCSIDQLGDCNSWHLYDDTQSVLWQSFACKCIDNNSLSKKRSHNLIAHFYLVVSRCSWPLVLGVQKKIFSKYSRTLMLCPFSLLMLLCMYYILCTLYIVHCTLYIYTIERTFLSISRNQSSEYCNLLKSRSINSYFNEIIYRVLVALNSRMVYTVDAHIAFISSTYMRFFRSFRVLMVQMSFDASVCIFYLSDTYSSLSLSLSDTYSSLSLSVSDAYSLSAISNKQKCCKKNQ